MTESILTFNFPANESPLNPSLLAKPDGGYLLAYRKDTLDAVFVAQPWKLSPAQYWGWKKVIIAEMDAELRFTGRELQHFEGEDPRLFHALNRTWCAYSTCPRSWRVWVMPFDLSHHFEKLGEPLLPDYRTNRFILGGPDEKNWTWIDNWSSQSLDCVYSFQPYCVLRFDERGERMGTVELKDELAWPYGPICGGTPSVLLPSGERLAFFHSFQQTGQRRDYCAGAVLQEPEWPYRPIRVFQRPVLTSQPRFNRWPWCETVFPRNRVVYPCGLVAKRDRVLVSYGVDDCQCAIASFTYDELKTYDTGA